MKWISVKKELPSTSFWRGSKLCLVVDIEERRGLAWYFNSSITRRHHKGHWNILFPSGLGKITHWMYYPELPEKKEDEAS